MEGAIDFSKRASICAIDFSKRVESRSISTRGLNRFHQRADARVTVSIVEGDGGVMASTAEVDGGGLASTEKGVDFFQKKLERSKGGGRVKAPIPSFSV